VMTAILLASLLVMSWTPLVDSDAMMRNSRRGIKMMKSTS
jgi:hypothetical protein